MRKILYILLLAFAAILSEQTASAQLGRLHFGAYKINKISLLSMRSVHGAAQVECTNDSLSFVMSNISGTVYNRGKAFVKGTADSVSVPAGTSTVVVSGNASLLPDVTFWEVLSCLAFDPADYTIDVSMTITNSAGVVRRYVKQNISVEALLHNVRGR